MNVYRVELMVIDHDCIGPDSVRDELENARYGNRCIAPSVMSIEGRDAGEWGDEHPLNHSKKAKAEFRRLFGAALPAQALTPAEPVLINGLTESETAATASVAGLTLPDGEQR